MGERTQSLRQHRTQHVRTGSYRCDCQAEFCELKAEGDLQAGQLKSSVDLDKLHQRLSKWFALPLKQLSGNANLEMAWKQIPETDYPLKATWPQLPCALSYRRVDSMNRHGRVRSKPSVRSTEARCCRSIAEALRSIVSPKPSAPNC